MKNFFAKLKYYDNQQQISRRALACKGSTKTDKNRFTHCKRCHSWQIFYHRELFTLIPLDFQITSTFQENLAKIQPVQNLHRLQLMGKDEK